MNQKEFKKICKSCGYANKDTVEEYCRGKHEFGDEDFLAVYRLQNRKNDAADRTLHGKWHIVDGGIRGCHPLDAAARAAGGGMTMAKLNSEIIVRTSELRPCFVKGRKALFHRWEPKMQVVGESALRGGHTAGQLAVTVGIVEYDDGTVHECYPYEIRFCDDKMKEYYFPEPPEEK